MAYLKIRAAAAPFVLVTMCAQAGLLAQKAAVTPLLVRLSCFAECVLDLTRLKRCHACTRIGHLTPECCAPQVVLLSASVNLVGDFLLITVS